MIEKTAPANEAPWQSPDPGQAQVLVVESDAGNLALLCDLLSSEGYHVAAAASGHAALEQFTIRRPELVILDSLLPDMWGSQVIESLHSQGCLAPTLMIIGALSPEIPHAAPHATAYFLKPYDIDALLHAVSILLNPPVEESFEEHSQ